MSKRRLAMALLLLCVLFSLLCDEIDALLPASNEDADDAKRYSPEEYELLSAVSVEDVFVGVPRGNAMIRFCWNSPCIQMESYHCCHHPTPPQCQVVASGDPFRPEWATFRHNMGNPHLLFLSAAQSPLSTYARSCNAMIRFCWTSTCIQQDSSHCCHDPIPLQCQVVASGDPFRLELDAVRHNMDSPFLC